MGYSGYIAGTVGCLIRGGCTIYGDCLVDEVRGGDCGGGGGGGRDCVLCLLTCTDTD